MLFKFWLASWKRLSSWSSHGYEWGDVEGRGGFKFLLRPNSFFWFEVTFNAQPSCYFTRLSEITVAGRRYQNRRKSCYRFTCFVHFFWVFGWPRWRTESGSPSRDWPLELVLKMEAVIEKECSALGGLFQTVIGDMKVSDFNFARQIILSESRSARKKKSTSQPINLPSSGLYSYGSSKFEFLSTDAIQQLYLQINANQLLLTQFT